MKAITKKMLLLVLLTTLLCCFFATFSSIAVGAEEPEQASFATMDEGATIRLAGDSTQNGIRFTMTMSKTDYETLTANAEFSAEFGIFIIPESYKTSVGDFTAENLFGENAIYRFGENNDSEGTYIWSAISSEMGKASVGEDDYVYKLSGAMINIKTVNVGRKFVGVGYYSYVENGTRIYKLADFYDGDVKNNARSAAQIAYDAINDEAGVLTEEQKAALTADYIEKTSFTIVWKSNGETVKTETLHYGEMPVAPENPIKAEDDAFTYSFKGWNKPVERATDNAEYEAEFTPVLKSFNAAKKQTVYVGKTAPLTHDDLKGIEYTLTSSDENVVKITDNKMVGVSAGTAQVTVSAVGYDREEVCEVTVESPIGYMVSDYYDLSEHIEFNGSAENYTVTAGGNYDAFGGSAVRFLSGGNSIKISGIAATSVSDQSKMLRFWVYSDKALTNVYVAGGNGVTGAINAREWTKVEFSLWHYEQWGKLVKNELGIYELSGLTIDEYDGAEVYVAGFEISSSAIDSLNVDFVYESNINADGNDYMVPAGNCGADITVTDVTEGATVYLTENKTFVPVAPHEYKISYSVTLYGRVIEKEITINTYDSRAAKFTYKPANVLFTPDGETTLSAYANAHKPSGTPDATIGCTAEIHYYMSSELTAAYGGGVPFDALSSDMKLQNDWIVMLTWKISNEYGFEEYKQFIYCRTTENTVIPVTPDNVTIIGAAELVNLSGNEENPVYSIRVTGYAQIIFSNVFNGVNDSDNRLTFMVLASNHSETDCNLNVYNKAGTLALGGATQYKMNDSPIMINIGQNFGNENYFDQENKLHLQVDITNSQAEIYIDFLVVGTNVTVD